MISFHFVRNAYDVTPTADFQLQSIAPEVATVLSRIRRRIRTLVVLEGLAVALIWLVVMFWIALALDYLPVRFGLNELSRTARIILLGVTGAATAWLIWRFILKRVFASLKDTSIALLLERKYPEFNESLLTTVERTNQSLDRSVPLANESLLQQAADHANGLCKNISLSKVLNHRHIFRTLKIASLGLLSIGLFAAISPNTMGTAVARLCFLDQQQWPRQNNIQLVGLKVEYQTPVEGIEEFNAPLRNRIDVATIASPSAPESASPSVSTIPSPNVGNTRGIFYVAKGAAINLTVRAQTENAVTEGSGLSPKIAPPSCVMHFQSNNGNWSSQTLNRIGNASGGWQTYRLRGTPFGSISEDLTFFLQGGDHRIGPFQIHAVDEPLVESAELDCVFPNYMVDEQSGRWTPRSLPVAGRMAIPLGTRVDVMAATNRKLSKVYAIDQNTGDMTRAEITSAGFTLPIEKIDGNRDIAFYMVDQYGVVSETPHRITLDSVDDQPPTVEGILVGIGSAITPNALLPISGSITDDYDVNSIWLEIETPVSDTIRKEVTQSKDGSIDTRFDFRQYAQDNTGFALPDQNAEVLVVLKASDKMNLGTGVNVGFGDEHALELVSSSTLLKLMEQLEVGQRKRLEQIFNEVSDVREYLVRAKPATSNSDADGVVLEPGETSGSSPSATRQSDDLRILFAQRSILQIDKSSKEIAGVANAFDDIRMQLINNRVDSEDRKIRLAKQIVAPLRSITDGILKELRQTVTKLDKLLVEDADDNAASRLTGQAIRQTDQTLAQIDEVLSILVKYETQNELLDIVRRMIDEQETLLDEVKKLRQREAFDDLFE